MVGRGVASGGVGLFEIVQFGADELLQGQQIWVLRHAEEIATFEPKFFGEVRVDWPDDIVDQKIFRDRAPIAGNGRIKCPAFAFTQGHSQIEDHIGFGVVGRIHEHIIAHPAVIGAPHIQTLICKALQQPVLFGIKGVEIAQFAKGGFVEICCDFALGQICIIAVVYYLGMEAA